MHWSSTLQGTTRVKQRLYTQTEFVPFMPKVHLFILDLLLQTCALFRIMTVICVSYYKYQFILVKVHVLDGNAFLIVEGR